MLSNYAYNIKGVALAGLYVDPLIVVVYTKQTISTFATMDPHP